MEGFLIWEWGLIFPGWRWLYEPQVGVSTPSGAVLTREVSVVILGLLELYIYGSISDLGMDIILPGWR